MLAKLIVEGKEFDIEIQDPKLKELLTPKKKTGYERVEKENDSYYFDNGGGYVGDSVDPFPKSEGNNAYKAGNYYTSVQVAENNVRADKLMRQLRRFAVEHRTKDNPTEKYYIYYVKQVGLQTMRSTDRYIGPWFDNQHAGAEAIETFKDELIWYFTEYKDSL